MRGIKRSLSGFVGIIAAAITSNMASAQVVNYDFETGTLEGWTNNMTSSTGPAQFEAFENDFSVNAPVAQSGSWQVAPDVPHFNCCPQDQPHQTLVLASPQFALDPTGSITFHLIGGDGGLASPGGSLSTLPPQQHRWAAGVHGGGAAERQHRRVPPRRPQVRRRGEL